MKPPFGTRRVVPRNAPAFRLIGNLLDEKDPGLTFDSVIESLRHLFNEGESFPRDTLSNGQNLLHVSFLHI